MGARKAKMTKGKTGKAPAFQFYVMDWMRDLEEYPLEIEGAWIRIICKLWFSDKRGSLTRTADQWGRILRIPEEEAVRIITKLKDEKIGDVTFCHGQCNGDITVECRRMLRTERSKEGNRIRQKRHRETGGRYGDVTPHVTPMSHHPSSSSSSSSLYLRNKSNKEGGAISDGSAGTGFQKNAGGSTEPDRPPSYWTSEHIRQKAWEIQAALELADAELPAVTDLICNRFSRINPALTATRDRMQAANEGTAEPIENVMAYFTSIAKGESDGG